MKWFLSFSASLFALISFAQDTLVKKDSTEISAKADSSIKLVENKIVRFYDSLVLQEFGFGFLENSVHTYPEDMEVPEYTDSFYIPYFDTLDLNSPINLKYYPIVKPYIELYTVTRRDLSFKLLGKQELYFPMFEEYLRKYDLPLELKYLAIIESGLNGAARSRVGAAGLWQFMSRTGKAYGLDITSYIDQRNDPELSTDAACRYLKFLYGMYGDWGLVLSAYNAGPGTVNRAIRRSGGKKSFWLVRRYLPRETRAYFPAFLAVNYVFNYYDNHNLYPIDYIYKDFNTDTVMVKQTISFDKLSQVLSIPKEDIKELNPQYYRGIIPVVKQPMPLKLPVDKLGLFVSNEDSIYKYKTVKEIEVESKAQQIAKEEKDIRENKAIIYKVKSGDVLGRIANKYGVRVSDIKRWNGLHSDNLRIGQRLTIYPSGYSATKSTAKSSSEKVNKDKFQLYTIRKGDNLWDIANKYPGINVNDIKYINPTLNANNLKIGQQIKIPIL